MGAYKKLNKQDAYITSRTAHKTYTLNSTQYPSAGITIQYASASLYDSVKHLYYPSRSQDNILSHSYDYYDQTTLYNPDTRQNFTSASEYTTGSLVMSIPRSLYGTYVKPGPPFQIRLFDMLQTPYITREYDYWPDVSIYTPEILPEDDEVIEQENEVVTVVDDEEGGLYLFGTDPKRYVGDIIYSHGIIVITDPATVVGATSTLAVKTEITWQTSHPIFTHTYHCRIKESEYNHTYNPSATTTQTGILKDNVTGSSFQPYITTVGLYNDNNELVAVGKMGQPVPKSANTEMTIVVKIDI